MSNTPPSYVIGKKYNTAILYRLYHIPIFGKIASAAYDAKMRENNKPFSYTITLVAVLVSVFCTPCFANTQHVLASAEYVQASVANHSNNNDNPHNVTAEQIGLGNVQNVDTTNADNITSGTVSTDRLPIGTTANTVASGDDARFYAVPRTLPNGEPPAGAVWMWF